MLSPFMMYKMISVILSLFYRFGRIATRFQKTGIHRGLCLIRGTVNDWNTNKRRREFV